MQQFSLLPCHRNVAPDPVWRSLGFDRLLELVDDSMSESDGFPLYRVERSGEDHFLDPAGARRLHLGRHHHTLPIYESRIASASVTIDVSSAASRSTDRDRDRVAPWFNNSAPTLTLPKSPAAQQIANSRRTESARQHNGGIGCNAAYFLAAAWARLPRSDTGKAWPC